MVRRYIGQIGITILLALGLGSGVALADSGDQTSPSNTQQNEQSSNISVSGSGQSTVDVQNSQQSSQSSDSQSQGTAPTVSDDGAGTPGPTATSGTGLYLGSMLKAHDGQVTTVQATPVTTPTGTPSAKSSSAPSDTKKSHDNDAIFFGGSDHARPLSVSSSPMSGTPAAPSPTTPTAPLGGLLQHIRALLADVFVPAQIGLLNPLDSMGFSALVAQPLLLVLFALILTLSVPISVYTARLRRSGYIGAPRSDVAAATNLFATPLKWVLSGRALAT